MPYLVLDDEDLAERAKIRTNYARQVESALNVLEDEGYYLRFVRDLETGTQYIFSTAEPQPKKRKGLND